MALGWVVAALMALAALALAPACGEARTRAPAAEATPAPEGRGGGAFVTGTITYRERVALGPDAVATIQLRDVSLADAPSVLVAEQSIANPGSVPIAFRIEYDPAAIDERRTYGIQADIREGGRLLFANDTAYDVITGGQPAHVDMVLVRVAP